MPTMRVCEHLMVVVMTVAVAVVDILVCMAVSVFACRYTILVIIGHLQSECGICSCGLEGKVTLAKLNRRASEALPGESICAPLLHSSSPFDHFLGNCEFLSMSIKVCGIRTSCACSLRRRTPPHPNGNWCMESVRQRCI